MSAAPKRLLEGGSAGSRGAAIYRLLSQLPKDAQDAPETERRWEENVWRRLPRAKRSPRLAWLALVPASLAAAAVLLWIRPPAPHRSSPLARLDEAVGSVQSSEAEGRSSREEPARRWREAREGDALLVQSRLRTDGKSHAVLALAGIARVLLSPASELSIAAVGPETLLRLTQGGLLAHVTKRPPGQSFVIELHGYRVRVVGTVFSVSEGERGSVEVGVSEGVVEVQAGDGRIWRVAAGESWSSAQPPAAPPARASSPGAAPAAPAQLAPGQRARPLAGGLSPEAGPCDPDSGCTAETHAVRSATPSLVEPPPAAPPIPIPNPALPAVSPPQSSVGASGLSLDPPPVVLAPDHPLALAGPAPASARAASGGGPSPAAGRPAGPPLAATPDLYAQASNLSAHGRYREAAAELQALIDGGGPHVDLALYELARLRQAHLGDLPGAIELFDRYRSRYPHGALEPEAGLSIIQAELARGELDRARTEMDRFLAEHPGSERAEEVHLLRGNVLRESRQCARAIEDYRLCKDPRLADDALYFTAWCEKKLGRAEAAVGALRGYLKRFPAGRHLDDVRQALEPAE